MTMITLYTRACLDIDTRDLLLSASGALNHHDSCHEIRALESDIGTTPTAAHSQSARDSSCPRIFSGPITQLKAG
jgi:hypothetical protein